MAFDDARDRDREDVDDRRKAGEDHADQEPTAADQKDEDRSYKFTDWASI